MTKIEYKNNYAIFLDIDGCLNSDKTWEELKEKYQNMYNVLHSMCKSLYQLH